MSGMVMLHTPSELVMYQKQMLLQNAGLILNNGKGDKQKSNSLHLFRDRKILIVDLMLICLCV